MVFTEPSMRGDTKAHGYFFAKSVDKKFMKGDAESVTLIRESPPALTWRDRLEPLKAAPNEWIRVFDYALPSTAYSVVSALRRGDYPTPSGSWQFRASKKEGKGVVYARYLEPEGASDHPTASDTLEVSA
jgi:hypothetical protein